ncbi:N-acetylmuramoyl-L-alanine amidase [Bacteroidota bacterium]
MKTKFLCILILLSAANIFAQPFDYISVISDKGIKDIPSYKREKTVYFSIRDFADAASINYFYNRKNGKIELKFDNYLLKISAKNPYFVITERSTGSKIIYQLPTSSYIFNGRIFIPLIFSIDPIEKAWGKRIYLSEPKKIIVGKNFGVSDVNFFPDKEIEGTLPGASFNITGLTVSERANGTLITIHSNKRIPSYYSAHKDGILTIILRQVKADTKRTDRENMNGLIKNITAENIGPDTEFNFSVGEEYSTNEVMNVEGTNDILITIHNKIFTNAEDEKRTREKWDFDVIVIDPGHGGKDPGAIGLNKIKEKDVNLKVALELGKLIEEKMEDVKIVYTRSTDRFVDLYKRGKMANEHGGKLFISIHCNSTKKKSSDATGIEVYLLRPGRTQEAINIAERENRVIEYESDPTRYEQLNDENFILVSMAHSSYMKYSESFADMLNTQFRNNTKLKARGVKQAGFYVLVGASMPSVLIESGFITNKKDVNYLDSSSGREQLAEAMFEAIEEYRQFYVKQMEAEL